MSDALFSSAIFQGEDGSSLPAGFGPGFQYGMEDDPELAMVSFNFKFVQNECFQELISRRYVFQWKKVDSNKKLTRKKQANEWTWIQIKVNFKIIII